MATELSSFASLSHFRRATGCDVKWRMYIDIYTIHCSLSVRRQETVLLQPLLDILLSSVEPSSTSANGVESLKQRAG